jgi:hypothetical protein
MRTPGTTAPVESVTVPTTVAVPVDCANMGSAAKSRIARRDNIVTSKSNPFRALAEVLYKRDEFKRHGQSSRSK